MSRKISYGSERSVRSVSRERMILLFNSTTIPGDCHFIEELVNFERHSNNDRPTGEQKYIEVFVSSVRQG